MNVRSPMEHDEAERLLAVERYILNELSPEETDRFEEHFFACSDCAEAIRSASVFRDGLKAVATEQYADRAHQARRGKNWRAWFQLPVLVPIAAAAALAVVVVYQQAIVIPNLNGRVASLSVPRPATLIMARPLERGAEANVVRVPPASSPTIYFDPPIDAKPYPRYRCEIHDGNRVIASLMLDAPPAGQPFAVNLHGISSSARDYMIELYGVPAEGNPSPGNLIARYSFRVSQPIHDQD